MSKQERPHAQSKSRRRRRQAQDITVASTSGVTMRPAVIRAADHKYGSRKTWGKLQFVMAELCAIYPDGPPQDIKGHDQKLVKDINDRLLGKLEKADNGLVVAKPGYLANSGYKAKYKNSPVNHMTVKRALEKLRAG